ncbi:MAG: hypothetical protein ACYDAI_03705 [Trichloromonadaceae bacterium]
MEMESFADFMLTPLEIEFGFPFQIDSKEHPSNHILGTSFADESNYPGTADLKGIDLIKAISSSCDRTISLFFMARVMNSLAPCGAKAHPANLATTARAPG